ncbi:MAG: hypothetical protein E6J34_17200 [Chloroflexi bacterium]|nr:MAG: hypothetical protein E6J34_17200 [Chloroflexota bacterium]
MTRTILDRELKELDEQMVRLGSMVDDALGIVLEALATGDLAKSGMVIENDALIDSLRTAIEEHTIRLLTLQQPLGGRDLRYLASALSIAGDLERTGDGVAGIATNVLRMAPLRGDTMPNVKIEPIAGKGHSGNAEVSEATILHGIVDLGKEAYLGGG